MLQVKTSVELSGKREVCSFRRNSTRMALQWSAELEQLLAQAISELYPAASWVRRREGDAGRTVGKCNVCQAVNEQFHGNIVTLLLTAIGAEFLSRSNSNREQQQQQFLSSFSFSSSSIPISISSWGDHSLACCANACLIDLLMFTCACLLCPGL